MGSKARAGDGQQRSNRRKKCEAVTVRLLAAQKKELEKKAAFVDMSVPAFMREMSLMDRPLSPARINDAALNKISGLSYQLQKIGTLLNQIAHACNLSGQFLNQTQFDDLSSDLKIVVAASGELIRNISNHAGEDDT